MLCRPQGMLLCTCGVADRALACSCVLVVFEQQYDIHTRSCPVALKAYTLLVHLKLYVCRPEGIYMLLCT